MTIRNGKIEVGKVVWKKVKLWSVDAGGNPDWFKGFAVVKLVTLEEGVVPTKHRRGNRHNWEDGHRKCRIPKAYIADIIPIGGANSTGWTARSGRDIYFEYRLGEIVVPGWYDSNPKNICTGGIHVFLTRSEAEAYPI